MYMHIHMYLSKSNDSNCKALSHTALICYPYPFLCLSPILSSIDPLRRCLPSSIIKFSTLALHVDMQKSSIMIGIPRADLYNLHAFVLLANGILCMHVCVMYSESKEGRAIVKSY